MQSKVMGWTQTFFIIDYVQSLRVDCDLDL